MASETPSKESPSRLGSLIRMRALDIHQLPAHSSLADKRKDAGQDIQAFIFTALDEAEEFMTSYLTTNFTVKDTGKSSPPAKAPVKLLQHEITPDKLPRTTAAAAPAGSESTEHWFARESLHENKAEEQTASWEEFDYGLRVDHSKHEQEYTPDVQDAHEVLNWDAELEKVGRRIGDWRDLHASVMEMVHHIPAPLNNRVFPVLVITGKKGDSFLVVQIPVAVQDLPNVKYQGAAKITTGMYCSIERAELVEEGKKTKWQMATASDAKGVLPMWAQKMGVPGAVVKDVGLFIKWVAERRQKGKV